MKVAEARIYAYNLDSAKAKVAKINRRAKKLGLEPLEMVIGPEEVVKERVCVDPFFMITREVVNVYRHVEIHGEIPVIPGGWELIGLIEHDSLNILKTVPGKEIPEFFYDRTVCDHCNTNRTRNKTIIVKNTEGEYKQVGTTCVQSYLGINPNTLLYFMESKDFFEEYNGHHKEQETFDILDFTDVAVAVINEFGWKSRSEVYNSGGYATADRIIDFYNPYSKEGAEVRKILKGKINDETKEYARKALEWVATVDKNTDYFFNLKKMVECGIVPVKGAGFAASIIPAYYREVVNKKEEKISEWQGEVGKKITAEVKFVGEFSFDSYYGVTLIKRFLDKDGNIFVWFTKSVSDDFEEDKIYTITGTVKKHDLYKEKKQTVLSRVKEVKK